MTGEVPIRRLHTVDESQIEGLAEVLIDCVDGDDGVSFLHPVAPEKAQAFWREVADGVASGGRALLVAEDERGIVGTVQLVLSQPENQPHRADLSKMLVHRRARRRGLGAALLRAAEETARECWQDAARARHEHGQRRRAPLRADGLGAGRRDPGLLRAAAGRAARDDGLLQDPLIPDAGRPLGAPPREQA